MSQGCSCGCGAMTSVTVAAEACGCGCGCCGDQPKTKEQEILELTSLREAVERRLAELESM